MMKTFHGEKFGRIREDSFAIDLSGPFPLRVLLIKFIKWLKKANYTLVFYGLGLSLCQPLLYD